MRPIPMHIHNTARVLNVGSREDSGFKFFPVLVCGVVVLESEMVAFDDLVL